MTFIVALPVIGCEALPQPRSSNAIDAETLAPSFVPPVAMPASTLIAAAVCARANEPTSAGDLILEDVFFSVSGTSGGCPLAQSNAVQVSDHLHSLIDGMRPYRDVGLTAHVVFDDAIAIQKNGYIDIPHSMGRLLSQLCLELDDVCAQARSPKDYIPREPFLTVFGPFV